MPLHIINIMPEGPELKIICDNLNNYLSNKSIHKLTINSGRYFPESRHPEHYQDFINSLPLRIIDISVKGKLLYFILENNWIILNTMGMSGKWTKHHQNHCHITLEYDNGKTLWFCDIRRFGTIKFLKSIEQLDKKLKSLGPDMLSGDVTFEDFEKIAQKYPNKYVTQFMMDQKIISGCGNYIKAESLYRAMISPHKKMNQINNKDLLTLFNQIKYVINASYQSQGATIANFENVDKETGGFTFLVYGRNTDDFGHTIIHETTQDGRTTHWVEEIQA